MAERRNGTAAPETHSVVRTGQRDERAGTATFTGVRMRAADLTGARCQGATFRGTDLSALDPATTEIRHAIITADQAVVAMVLGLDVRPG